MLLPLPLLLVAAQTTPAIPPTGPALTEEIRAADAAFFRIYFED